jgi:ParB family chromosome partitioning protein
MRHDTHFVDQLVRPGTETVGRLIPAEEIDPNPNQPRQTLGDLAELTASVREKGVLEPLLVRRVNGRYQIIAGERRYRAAVEAGLSELPCVIREASDAETMEIALIENLQRKDLTPFEEADAMQGLATRCGYTHEELAKKLSRSRTSITESLALTKMPDEVRNLCRLADISSKSLLLEIVRQSDHQKMLALVEKIASGQSTREAVRRETARPRPKAGRPRAYVFSFRPPTKTFSMKLQFRKAEVEKQEIIETLEGIIAELRSGT